MICMSCISYTLYKLEQLFCLPYVSPTHCIIINLNAFIKVLYIGVSLIKKNHSEGAYKKRAVCFIVV